MRCGVASSESNTWYAVPANLSSSTCAASSGPLSPVGVLGPGRVPVPQAALESACVYVLDRIQFGKATVEYGLTQFMIGKMAAKLAASRAITYAAAVAMDEDERKAAPLAAQAKLLSCDIAVAITQDAQLLHGGWGYAEEYAISRYVVDAQVLPIFEGVKPILALKVVGRALLAGG